MISGRAVLWCLLLGVLVMLLVRMPGVRLYDYLATRLRSGQSDEPSGQAHAAEAVSYTHLRAHET